jgi:hypothetical protein
LAAKYNAVDFLKEEINSSSKKIFQLRKTIFKRFQGEKIVNVSQETETDFAKKIPQLKIEQNQLKNEFGCHKRVE